MQPVPRSPVSSLNHSRAPRKATSCIKRCFSRGGFTLVELLVATSIVTLVASFIYPALGRMMDSAKATKCIHNWRSYGQALSEYVADNNGRLPLSAYTAGADQEVRIFLSPYLFSEASTNKEKMKRTALLDCPHSEWGYGFNAYTSEQPISRYTQPSRTIYGIDLCAGGRWLDGSVLGSKRGDLKEAVPKPHSSRVNVLWLDGHTSSEKVSELYAEDVTRNSSDTELTDKRTAIGQIKFDR